MQEFALASREGAAQQGINFRFTHGKVKGDGGIQPLSPQLPGLTMTSQPRRFWPSWKQALANLGKKLEPICLSSSSLGMEGSQR